MGMYSAILPNHTLDIRFINTKKYGNPKCNDDFNAPFLTIFFHQHSWFCKKGCKN